MKNRSLSIATLFTLGLGGLAACSATPGTNASADAVTLAPAGQDLVPAQITPIALDRSQETTVHYSGHTRYVGKKVHVAKGEDIVVETWIDQGGASPVAVVTDANLHVLLREVGGTITGSPEVSSVFIDLIAPADGAYWVLFGEDDRTKIDLKLTYLVRSSAGAACHADLDCVGGACVAGACELTPAFGSCLLDTDCTAGACNELGKSAGQCAALPEGTCKLAGDCAKHVCTAGACGCVPAGQKPPADFDEAFACCNQEVDDRDVCK
jgi:hypothetical protein